MFSESRCLLLFQKECLYHLHMSAGLSIIVYEMPGTWEGLWKYPFSGLLESKYTFPISTSRLPRYLGWEDPLEWEVTPHSNITPWEIPRTREPGRPQPIGSPSIVSQRAGHNRAIKPEKAMAPHCSTLAWKIPWTEEPSGLQSMGSLRVRYN